MHARIDHTWIVAQLSALAALSRSAFFDRFTRIVGVAPMEYLLAWRMEIARDVLRRKGLGIAQVAERVGYASTSTFSTAFSRHGGQSPRQYVLRTASKPLSSSEQRAPRVCTGSTVPRAVTGHMLAPAFRQRARSADGQPPNCNYPGNDRRRSHRSFKSSATTESNQPLNRHC
ncbi:helix-turn-helix transcriptional regulator [Acidovorax sp. Leaf73]|uniref:helix-turn-helix transcriptional regulator n=1 Tax=Acidovorax sp. Leaf73 TaxID=2876566 RepID=UPI001E4B5BED|nr:helix-turn-helix transcriptional regulator [Acidovorax sp. Leaf73]